MNDEIELWQSFVNGDESAVDGLYERYKNYVFWYCVRRVTSWHEAEDLTADVFIELWCRREKLILHQDGVRPLLAMIAFGHTSNHLRSRKRKKDPPRIAPPEDAADPADRVAAQVDAERKAEKVRAMLAHLSPEEREAFETPMWLDLTVAQAAKVMGISESTLKRRRAQARRKLRSFGAEFDGEEA